MIKILHLITIAILLFGCLTDKKTEIPDYIRELEHLTVFSADKEPDIRLELVKEAVFGSTDEVLMGNFVRPAVDALGRVYLGDMGEHTVHIFDHDGNYLTRIGRQGQGPGEFLGLPIPHIVSEKLYIYDHMQLRVSVYSTETGELSRTINLNPRNQYSIEELNDLYLTNIYFINDGRFIAAFKERLVFEPTHSRYNLEDERYIKYYLMDSEGRILPDKLFEQIDREYITATVRGELKFASYPFLAKSLIAVSEDGHIFSASSTDFLIELRQPDGEYLRAFYYPLEKRDFTREEALNFDYGNMSSEELVRNSLDVLRNAPDNDLPETWPVLEEMLVDDENRLWISTIVEDEDVYEWWVLQETGELISKFIWPKEQSIDVIKNGYVYSRETDEMGVASIVSYRIEMEDN